MHFDLAPSVIFLGISGSHAYGMATPTSDLDLRGVCIPPREIRESFFRKFDQFQGEPSAPDREVLERAFSRKLPSAYLEALRGSWQDTVIFGLHKAVSLMSDANPNMLELLFLPEDCIVVDSLPWKTIREARSLFLSQRCRFTFMGYAVSQFRRIQSHREWLLRPPKAKPERREFGLPESSLLPANVRSEIEEAIQERVRSWDADHLLEGAPLDVLRERMLDFWEAVLKAEGRESVEDLAAQDLGVPEGIRSIISAEKRYRAALAHWNSYLKWKTERNPARQKLEADFGYDTKHASHLLRLSRMCLEILTTGQVLVRRPDAEELLAVRRGSLRYEELEAEFRRLESIIKDAPTCLPRAPDREAIDRIILSILDHT